MHCSKEEWLNEQAMAIVNSYRHWTGKRLIEAESAHRDGDWPPEETFRRLFAAPLVVLAHGVEADPVLNFGNKAALRLWEMNWDKFTRMPSRLTAEPMERDVRAAFMKQVAERGYADDYAGVRISATGRRFRIERATVWNVIGPDGAYRGQAAAFPADGVRMLDADPSADEK